MSTIFQIGDWVIAKGKTYSAETWELFTRDFPMRVGRVEHIIRNGDACDETTLIFLERKGDVPRYGFFPDDLIKINDES